MTVQQATRTRPGVELRVSQVRGIEPDAWDLPAWLDATRYTSAA